MFFLLSGLLSGIGFAYLLVLNIFVLQNIHWTFVCKAILGEIIGIVIGVILSVRLLLK